MDVSTQFTTVQSKFQALQPHIDERARRCWAGTEALALGRGGITVVAEATGLSPHTIRLGIKEIQAQTQGVPPDLPLDRIRRPGGGRQPLVQTDPTLLTDLRLLLEATTRGDPESPLLWTCKSTRNLAAELVALGHTVSHRTIATLLEDLEYSLQANRKVREGTSHPDRNAQFEYINTQFKSFQQQGQPVISVDTKKKELIGDFKNAGA